jgi:hypothetical protein
LCRRRNEIGAAEAAPLPVVTVRRERGPPQAIALPKLAPALVQFTVFHQVFR